MRERTVNYFDLIDLVGLVDSLDSHIVGTDIMFDDVMRGLSRLIKDL